MAMNKVTIILFLICSSCVHIEPQYRYTISYRFKKCKRVLYDLEKMKVISDIVDLPLEDCDDVTGFKTQKLITPIKPWINYQIKHCKGK